MLSKELRKKIKKRGKKSGKSKEEIKEILKSVEEKLINKNQEDAEDIITETLAGFGIILLSPLALIAPIFGDEDEDSEFPEDFFFSDDRY